MVITLETSKTRLKRTPLLVFEFQCIAISKWTTIWILSQLDFQMPISDKTNFTTREITKHIFPSNKKHPNQLATLWPLALKNKIPVRTLEWSRDHCILTWLSGLPAGLLPLSLRESKDCSLRGSFRERERKKERKKERERERWMGAHHTRS